MKTITIPTCSNPFVVYVNGKKYTYPAGTEQEVPDEVALIIEQHYDGHKEKYHPVDAPFNPDFDVPEKSTVHTGYTAPTNPDAKFWVNPNGNVGAKSAETYDSISGIAGALSAFLSGTAKRYDTITEALAEGAGKTDGTGKVLGYTCGGKLNIMLLDDIESSTQIEVAKDCTIHMNGHKLSFTESSGRLHCSGTSEVTINGTVTGSEITKNIANGLSGFLVTCQGTRLNLVGGTYTMNGTSNAMIAAVYTYAPISMIGCRVEMNVNGSGGVNGLLATNDVTVDQCVFNITGQNSGEAYAIKSVAQEYKMNVQRSNIAVKTNGVSVFGIGAGSKYCNLKNCIISAAAPVTGSSAIGLNTNNDMEGISLFVENCKISADGHADISKDPDLGGIRPAFAISANKGAILTINGGDYWGAREALSVHGTAYINGGVFKGCAHGGAYMSSDNVHVKNATFCNVVYRGECGWDEPNPDGSQNWYGGACYCGGSDPVNANVWFDNCWFGIEDHAEHFIVAKYTGTSVYLSNCEFDKPDRVLRSDTGSNNMIYVGKNVNSGKFIAYGDVDTTTYANEEFGYETETTTDNALLCVKDERGNWVGIC